MTAHRARRSHRLFADTELVGWAASRCLALTTFRADGSPVTTPVWFVTCDGELRCWTGADSAKVRRLRRNPQCRVAPCTTRGRVTGAAVAGTALPVASEHAAETHRLLRAKYPVQKRALDGYGWVRRRGRPADPAASVCLAITLAQ